MRRRKRKRRSAKDVFDINKAADDAFHEWFNNGSSSIIPEDPTIPPIKNSGQFIFNSKFKIYYYYNNGYKNLKVKFIR